MKPVTPGRHWFFVVVSLVLLGSSGAESSNDLVRAANSAVAENRLEDALVLYTQAERRTTDPGLVAFNKAAILYRLERYREAERHYERALAGAKGVRMAKSYYGLGTAKLRLSEGTEAQVLSHAVECFRLCRAVSPLPKDLRKKADSNLELARVLLAKARANLANKKEPKQDGNDKTQNNNSDPDSKPEENGGPQNTEGQAEPTKTKETGKKAEGKNEEDAPPIPGKGNLPPLADDDKLQPIDPEDARRYLEQMLRRIEQQREKEDGTSRQSSSGVKDW
ncbi:MAG: hypothetical protein ACFCD0_30015 [Gemmataceae bacterium]